MPTKPTTKKAATKKAAPKKAAPAQKPTLKAEQKPEQDGALKELFTDELKDILWAENQLVKSFKKLSKASTSDELKSTFDAQLSKATEQISRLEKVFELVDEKASPKKCEAMAGLAKEAEELTEDTDEGTMVRDVALISAAQKCTHYEIASYGTIKALAGTLNYAEAAKLLNQTLKEKKQADEAFTTVAETVVNGPAAKEKE